MGIHIFHSVQNFVTKWWKKYITNQLAYVYNYEKTVQELDNAVEKLRKEEKDVLEQAEEDEDKYGRERHDNVKGWLVRVEKILSEYEEFKKYEDRECLGCFLVFPNLKARFDNGKIVEDIKEKIGELKKKKEGNESGCQEGPSSMGDDAIASSFNANNESCLQCHEAIVKLISTEYITNQLANLCYAEKNVEVEEQDKVDENLRREKDIIVCDTSQQAEYQDNESRCQGPSSIGDDASSSNANVESEQKGKVDQNLQEETEIIVCDTLSHQEEDQDEGEIDDGEVVSNSEHKKALEKHEERECLGFALVFPYLGKSYQLGKITEDVEKDCRERQMKKKDIESTMKLITESINQLFYMLNPRKKVAELDKVADNIQKVRDMLCDTSQQEEGQHRRQIDDGDKKLLDDVEEILLQVEDFKKREELEWGRHFLAVPNPISRYLQGKIAEVIKLKVEQLQKETHDNRSRWRGPLSMGDVFSNVDYESFESRKKTMNDIMAALEDPSSRMMGVHGSAGVGKTTLVIEAAKQAREGKLFDVMIMVQVTRSPDIRKLQGQIADMLGMTLEEESEQGRAARIKKRLKKENENTLIILDDLNAQVDLNMLGIPIENGGDGKLRNLKELGKSSTPGVHNEEIHNDGNSSENEETKSSSSMSASKAMKKTTLSTGSNKSITEEHHKVCKILLISEVRQVLVKQMDGKERLIFSVSNLNDNEAETLFKSMAGIDDKKSEYVKAAAKIARKCDGLPMTIATTARALKNQSYSVWEDTDRKLERQKLTGTPENSTKLSYQLLENEELKITFLLCARMGQDALISDLVKFCIGLGFLQDVYTVREARERVQTLLVMLKESGLLSDSYSTDRFTMQNLVRSAALSIASEEKHVFTLIEGKIDEWPAEDKLKRYNAISLRHCHAIEKFPKSIKCPRLRVFEVENNGSQLEIPDSFFKEMKELRVLCLTGINLKSLPSSIKFLTKLRMLYLEQCILSVGLYIIEELKNLRILSFSGSNIESLPVQLKYLSKLQVLDISNCSKLKVIPPNVISSLTSLEELYMRNTSIQWSVNEGQESQSENASISELGNLNQLTNLDIQIPSVAHLPKNLFFDKLYSYKIIIGSSNRYLLPGFKMPEKYELSRFLAIQQKDGFDIHSQKGIKMLFERVQDLMLEKLNGVQDIFYALNITGFPCLKHLSIVSNSSIQSLIKPKERKLPEEAFTKLKSLHLYKVKKMKQLCSCGSLSETSFARLKVIKIKLCHELKIVFSISMVRHLISLETIEVSECNSLKEIVPVHTSNANESLKFPNLRSVMLQSLSGFIGFYPTSLAPAEGTKILFNDEKIIVSKLEIMELSSIPIDQIWAEKSSPFENLIHLDVKHCENLKYLLSFSMARSLVKLQRLFVNECDQMEHLFFQGQDSNAKEKNCIFPKLKDIKLTRMRSLSEIWNSEVPTDSINNLDTLIIEECDKLVNVFTCYTMEIFQSLCSLTVKNCKSMKAIFDLADGKRYAKCKTKLQDVHLETLPELEQVLKWKRGQDSVVNWNNIRKIWLQDCERVENIFPSSVDKTFENLEYLVAWGCSRLREIVAKGEEGNSNNTNSAIEFKFPELTTIKFLELPNFKSFYPGECKLNCPKLKDLSIERCDKLEPFREKTTNNQGRCILFPVEVINELKSMQIESRYAKSSAGYNYRRDKLEELHLSGLRNIEILYSFLHHNPKLKSLWLNDCSFEVLVPLKRPAEIESLGFVPKLKSLNLINLAWLKEIGFERDTIFQRIESLSLKNCPRLDTIAPSSVSFSHLTNLEVVDCVGLKYLVSLRTAESLVQLSTVKVMNCNYLEEIVSEQGSEAEEKEGREKEEIASKFSIVFRQLKAIELVSLMSLESFCRSKSCAFEFPSLEKFVVNACSKLENFTEKVKGTIVLQKVYTVHEKENRCYWKGNLQDTIQFIFHNKKFFEGMDELNVSAHRELQKVWQCKKGPPKDWFYSLKTLKLKDCNFEKYAIPSNVLGRLKSLQELEVLFCINITFIFEKNDIEIRETPLRLKRLTLVWLPNVTHVWQQEQEEHKQGILSFKNLQQVSVYRCRKLQTLLPAALARDLKMLEKLEVVDCYELPQIVGNKEGAADGTVVFPRLTSLVLNWLPKLTCFYSESFAVECPELDYLDVIDCGKLELFQSQQETDREDQGCSSSNSIIRQTFFSDIKGISKVEILYLSWKDAKVWLGQSKDQYLQYLSELYLHLGDYEKENFTLPSAILEKAPNLEKMEIGYCSTLKEISAEGMLGHLKRLALCNLDELHSIWVLEYLPKLQQLRVFKCPRLTTLVQPSAAKMLTHLEEMYVEDCESMKKIVGKGEDETDVEEIKFERLEMISLIDLSRLECFYSGNAILQLPSLIQVNIRRCPEMKRFSQGSSHVEPPSRLIQVSYDPRDETGLVLPHDLNVVVGCLPVIELEHLRLRNYPALKGIWLGEVQIPFDCLFRNLNSLVVKGCEFLSNAILSSHLLPFLSNLGVLVVRKCDSVETIFDVKDTATNNSNMSVIPLRTLILEQLPTLRHVWNEDPKGRLSLPDLENVVVSECESIKSLFPASVPKDNLQKLAVRNCAGLVEIVAKEETAATEEANHKLDMFPKVTSLTLWDLPKLRCICSGMSILDWPKLKNLDVYGCPMLTIFATDSLSSPDSYPEEGEDHFTSEKHGIVSAQKIPPKLEHLSLDKENVVMIEQRPVPYLDLLLQNIKFLTLQGFDKDSVAFPHVFFSKVSLPRLQRLAVADSAFKEISTLEIMPQIDYTTRSFSSQRKRLELRALSKLNSIGFEHAWVAPLVENLQHLKVLACTCLTNLAPSTVSFSRLTELNVEDCAGLEYLFSFSTARSLVVLRNMSIINCESLETIVVADDEEGDRKDEVVIFTSLTHLYLDKLPKLRSFNIVTDLAPSTVSFSHLTWLYVKDCSGLEYLFTSSTANRLVVLSEISIINGESLETIVMAEDDGDKRDEVVIFTSLTYLYLDKLPKLRSFNIVTNLAPSTVSFSQLTKLYVEDCSGLEYLFTSSTARSFFVLKEMSITNCESLETVILADDDEGDKNDEDVVFPDLQKLDVRNCAKLEVIVAKDDETATEEVSKKVAMFPKVTSLMLWDLPKLRCICSGMDIPDWPVLQDLDVYHCQMLKTFATDFQNSPDLYPKGQDHFTTDKHGIISADKVPPNLERLSLNKEDFISIEQGLLPHVDLQLPKIKFLRMQGFNNDSDVLLPKVFFSKVSLSSIQEFGVADSAFKEIFSSQMSGMDFNTKSFSQLKKLELRSLHRLESIGFEHSGVAPLLENLPNLKVVACSCLTHLVPSTVSFSGLTKLNVEDCVGLKYLFTSSTAKRLVELATMSISNCESLETVVVADDEEGDEKDEDVVFPYLYILSLEKLPKLGSFYTGNSTVNFSAPSKVVSIKITQCKSMKTFSHGDVKVRRLGDLEIDGAKWDDDDLNSAVRQQFEKARKQP